MVKLLSLPPPEELILGDIERYHYLTVDQVIKLRKYSPGTLRDVQRKLKHLSDEGYALKIQRVGIVGHGSYKPVYALTGRGKTYLENIQKKQIRRVPRNSEMLEQSVQLLEHTLAVNDVLIGFECLARDYPHLFSLVQMIPEREMRKLFAGSGVETIADGFVKMLVQTTHGKFYQPLLLELERTTARDKQNWLSKVRRYTSMTVEHIQSYFHVVSMEFAIVTLTEHDCQNLVFWTEQELQHSHKKYYDDMFRFTWYDSTLTNLDFFCGLHWQKPFTKQPHPLFQDVQLDGV